MAEWANRCFRNRAQQGGKSLLVAGVGSEGAYREPERQRCASPRHLRGLGRPHSEGALDPVHKLMQRVIPGLLVQDRDFIWFWSSQTVSLFGDEISLLAIPLTAVIILHATAVQMGYVFAAALRQTSCSPCTPGPG